MPTACAVPPTACAMRVGSTVVTAIATVSWTPGSGPWTSRCPKLREGTYFPEWLLERRRRAEAAPTSVVATCYLLGVSTRRMDGLVRSLGITGRSKSQASVLASDLDELVRDFRAASRRRPRGVGPEGLCVAPRGPTLDGLLWNRGTGFDDVVSLLFAGLIIVPIILIFRPAAPRRRCGSSESSISR